MTHLTSWGAALELSCELGQVGHDSLGYPVFGAHTNCKARITPSYLPTLVPSLLWTALPIPCPNPAKALRAQNWLLTLSTQGCPEMLETFQ